MGNSENWYIVQCNPNCERKAAAEMRRRGFGVHVPRSAVVKRHHRTKKPIMKRRPLLVGYVFMRFKGPENWFALRQCQGVKGVLYIGNEKPFELPQSDLLAIIRAQRSMAYDDAQTRGIRKQMRMGKREVSAADRRAKLDRFHKGMDISAPMSAAERVIAQIVHITKKGTIKADIGGMTVEFTNIDDLEVIEPLDAVRKVA